MADNDVIGNLDNLISTVSGETPEYTVKDSNVDMIKAIDKCIDAAKGITGTTYEYANPDTDILHKMDDLADAIASSGGGGGSTTLIEKSITSNGTYKASDDSADGYSKVSVSVSPNVDSKSITENGTYNATSDELDGYSSVTVSVTPNLGTKSISENGTYAASSDNLDGYSSVTVSGVAPTFALHSGKIKNTDGSISEDSDYMYTDAFPMPNGEITFDVGTTGSFDYEGLTIYDENGDYVDYYNPTSRYRVVDLSSYYASGSRFIRLSFAVSRLQYVMCHDWVNGIMYSTEIPTQFKS